MSGISFDECKEIFRDYANVSSCYEKIQAVGVIGLAAIAGVAYIASLQTWRSSGESFRENFSYGYTVLFPSSEEEELLFNEDVMGSLALETAFHALRLVAP